MSDHRVAAAPRSPCSATAASTTRSLVASLAAARRSMTYLRGDILVDRTLRSICGEVKRDGCGHSNRLWIRLSDERRPAAGGYVGTHSIARWRPDFVAAARW